MLQYSKSSKAACHGPPPCKGTPIELGVLRYGQVSFTPYGETVQWRHWCASPSLLCGREKLTNASRADDWHRQGMRDAGYSEGPLDGEAGARYGVQRAQVRGLGVCFVGVCAS